MKIVLDGRPIQHSAARGLGRYTVNLLNNLLAIDHNNSYELFYDPFAPTPGTFAGVPSRLGIKPPFFIGPGSLLYNRYWLKKQLSLLKYDLFHFTCQIHLPPTLPSNSLVTVHDLLNLALKDLFYKFELAYQADLRYTRRQLQGAKKIIAVSENTKKDLIDLLGLEEEKITVIHEGIDENFLSSYPANEMRSVLDNYGLKEEYLIYFGGAEGRKNLLRLVEVFAELAKEFGKLILLLILDINDPPVAKIREKIADLALTGRVLIIGRVPDRELAILLKGAKLFVMPSLYEGFGLPPLEAQACRVPVASSPAASLKEILGEAALFFDPLDKKAMYNSLRALLTNSSLRNELIAKGIKNAGRFSWKSCAEKTLTLYDRALT